MSTAPARRPVDLSAWSVRMQEQNVNPTRSGRKRAGAASPGAGETRFIRHPAVRRPPTPGGRPGCAPHDALFSLLHRFSRRERRLSPLQQPGFPAAESTPRPTAIDSTPGQFPSPRTVHTLRFGQCEAFFTQVVHKSDSLRRAPQTPRSRKAFASEWIQKAGTPLILCPNPPGTQRAPRFDPKNPTGTPRRSAR